MIHSGTATVSFCTINFNIHFMQESQDETNMNMKTSFALTMLTIFQRVDIMYTWKPPVEIPTTKPTLSLLH